MHTECFMDGVKHIPGERRRERGREGGEEHPVAHQVMYLTVYPPRVYEVSQWKTADYTRQG